MSRMTVWRWRPASRMVLAAAAFVVVATATTGLTMFDRGLFQDDAQVLFRVFIADGGVWKKATLPLASPTRRLQSAPYAAALATPDPLLVLRVTNEALLLAIGVAAAALAQASLRAGRATALLAGVLTLSASSDWMTASMIGLGYDLAVLLHLIGLLGLIRWTESGRHGWLIVALTFGTASLWTIDAAATVHPFTPLLAWLGARDRDARRRLRLATVAWWACAAPYYVVFLRFLGDPASYAADAIVPSSWEDRLLRLGDLFAYNFRPWVWAFWRPQWYAPAGPEFSWRWRLGLAAVAAGVSAAAYLRLRQEDRQSDMSRAARASRLVGLAAVFLGFTMLANATFMAVHLAEFYYRTQLFSRVWASLALAAIAAIGLDQGRVVRWLCGGAALATVGMGVLGGQERQAYFSSYWDRHQRELASIADLLRRLPPDATLVLWRAADARFAATEAPYLARAWATLLSSDPTRECRTFLVSADRGTSCVPEDDALVCRGDVSPRCGVEIDRGTRAPYDRLVVMTYDPGAPAFRVERSLPAAFTPAGAPGAAAVGLYAPERLLIERRAGGLATSLLR
jgi:hypothetical protein